MISGLAIRYMMSELLSMQGKMKDIPKMYDEKFKNVTLDIKGTEQLVLIMSETENLPTQPSCQILEAALSELLSPKCSN